MTTAAAEPASVREAVHAVRNGDADAFGKIVRTYQRQVFGLALMIVRDPAAAEEVAQDAFVRAFTHLDAYEAHRPFYPWLATIAVRLAQNRLAQRHRVAMREAPPPATEVEDAAAAEPLTTLIANDESRRLWRLVSELPPGERSAVVLHYRQDLGVRDIARLLGVTAGTVKTFLFRARQKLRHRAGDASAKESV